MIDVAVNSGSTLSAGMYGLNSFCDFSIYNFPSEITAPADHDSLRQYLMLPK
jgi:hypothetical protein